RLSGRRLSRANSWRMLTQDLLEQVISEPQVRTAAERIARPGLARRLDAGARRYDVLSPWCSPLTGDGIRRPWTTTPTASIAASLGTLVAVASAGELARP